MYLGVIRSRPTAYSKVTIEHNDLNRKNVIRNLKFKRKYDIKINLFNVYTLCKWGPR